MSSLWVALLVFLEYGCIGRLSCSNDDNSASLNRRWLSDTRPRYSYSAFTIRRHSNELLAPDQSIPKPISRRQPYIDYKAIYGLRYNPVKPGNRTKTYPANVTKTPIINLPQHLLSGLLTGSHSKPSIGLLMNMFNIVSSPKIPCIPGNGSKLVGLTGICLNEQECQQQRGIAMDLCSPVYGVCCVCKPSFSMFALLNLFITLIMIIRLLIVAVQYGCNTQTEQNVSFFHASFTSDVISTIPCSFTVTIEQTVRQVMLEFILFELQPAQHGNCLDDIFVISVQNDNRAYPLLCGINSGQHIYLDIDTTYSRQIYLTAHFNSRKSPRAFLVKVTQLIHPQAPSSCLQYYNELHGVIKSFNYDNHSTVVPNINPSYLNNLNYAICIGRHTRFCSIVFNNKDDDMFQIINVSPDGSSIVPANQAGVEILNCPDDFIAINYLRLCGDRLNDGSKELDFSLNSPVFHTIAGPVVVAVKTDQANVGRGFKLSFQQNVCTHSSAQKHIAK
ncbi:uncharacterized protein LOC126579560 isoform X2 [Anopheles aquasalis]|uniref:uncharacterized protein LOC126579560 isoform X2 n=1 Tax=Anopheles aquasalis TaxID=42839 RepID=UPI00215AEA0C|nr:uncharacterized protein LOC126579560 isoform X2 [Anopheles aquasalis]